MMYLPGQCYVTYLLFLDPRRGPAAKALITANRVVPAGCTANEACALSLSAGYDVRFSSDSEGREMMVSDLTHKTSSVNARAHFLGPTTTITFTF